MITTPQTTTQTGVRQIVYRSRSLVPDTSRDLLDILRISAHRNGLDGITGCLHHQHPFFFQYIEGPQDAISHLLGRLHMDNRHSDLRVLLDRDSPHRLFADWSMTVSSLSHHDMTCWTPGAPKNLIDISPEEVIRFFQHVTTCLAQRQSAGRV